LGRPAALGSQPGRPFVQLKKARRSGPGWPDTDETVCPGLMFSRRVHRTEAVRSLPRRRARESNMYHQELRGRLRLRHISGAGTEFNGMIGSFCHFLMATFCLLTATLPWLRYPGVTSPQHARLLAHPQKCDNTTKKANASTERDTIAHKASKRKKLQYEGFPCGHPP
jgi:hypothetical protein